MSAGIDTGKAVLDIAVHGRAECWQVSNDLAGWRRLAEILWDADVGRIGIEASGGYERGVVAYLREAGFRVSLHQPIQVKAFATMRLRRAKNDRLDAHLIAAFTAILGVERPAPDKRFQAFADHLTFIEQVEEDIVRAKTRLEHQGDPRLRRQLESDLARATRRSPGRAQPPHRPTCAPMTTSPAASTWFSPFPASANEPPSR